MRCSKCEGFFFEFFFGSKYLSDPIHVVGNGNPHESTSMRRYEIESFVPLLQCFCPLGMSCGKCLTSFSKGGFLGGGGEPLSMEESALVSFEGGGEPHTRGSPSCSCLPCHANQVIMSQCT